MSCLPIGTKVRWSSQSRGCTTTKEGVVVYSFDEAKKDGLSNADYPCGVARDRFSDHNRMFDGNMWLSNKGVFISVPGGKTARATPKLYMPNPGKLEVVE